MLRYREDGPLREYSILMKKGLIQPLMLPIQGFAKVAFSRACWPLCMVACGDREDLLQFLRILLSRRESKMRRNCNKLCAGIALLYIDVVYLA